MNKLRSSQRWALALFALVALIAVVQWLFIGFTNGSFILTTALLVGAGTALVWAFLRERDRPRA